MVTQKYMQSATLVMAHFFLNSDQIAMRVIKGATFPVAAATLNSSRSKCKNLACRRGYIKHYICWANKRTDTHTKKKFKIDTACY